VDDSPCEQTLNSATFLVPITETDPLLSLWGWIKCQSGTFVQGLAGYPPRRFQLGYLDTLPDARKYRPGIHRVVLNLDALPRSAGSLIDQQMRDRLSEQDIALVSIELFAAAAVCPALRDALGTTRTPAMRALGYEGFDGWGVRLVSERCFLHPLKRALQVRLDAPNRSRWCLVPGVVS
jgi:hypothetical protein